MTWGRILQRILLGHYILWGKDRLFDQDKKTPLRVTLKEKLENIMHIAECLGLHSVLYSILMPYSFVPFEYQNDGLLAHVLEVYNIASAALLYLTLCIGFHLYVAGFHGFGLKQSSLWIVPWRMLHHHPIFGVEGGMELCTACWNEEYTYQFENAVLIPRRLQQWLRL